MKVSLTKLRSFVAVAQFRQFRKAADEVGLSQPALSAHVRDLERQLGVSLLSRTTRSVRLTTEGELFLHRLQKVLDDLDGAVLDLRDRAALSRGRVIVAATPSAASGLLPRAIARFQARYPGVQIQLVEDGSPGVAHRVETGEADLGVGPLSGQRSELSFSVLCRDRFVGIVAEGHALAGRSRVRLRELVEYPLLVTHRETSIRTSVEAALREGGLEFQTQHRVEQHQTIVAMVAAGLGVALLPSLALAVLDHKQVVRLSVTDPIVSRDIGVIQHKGGSASFAARQFVQLLST